MDRVMSRNGYSYAEDNPVNYTDPSGKFLNFILGAAIGALVGAASSYAYANSLYNLAVSGSCGCDIKQQAEKIGRGQFVGDAVIHGVVVGAVTGVIASINPLIAIVGGGGLGALTALDAIRKGVGSGNACNDLQYLAGLLGIVAAGVGVGGAPGFQVAPSGALAVAATMSVEAAAGAVGGSAAVLMASRPMPNRKPPGPGGSSQPYSENELSDAGTEPDKNLYDRAGFSIGKHVDRAARPQDWHALANQLTGKNVPPNPLGRNPVGQIILDYIIGNSDTVWKPGYSKGVGVPTVEGRLPNGLGAQWNLNNGELIGFLD